MPYGNTDLTPKWKGEDFTKGDPVEFGHKDYEPEYGIISFLDKEYMTVCTSCAGGPNEPYPRAVNVVVSPVIPVRKLKDDELSKLDASLKEGCQTHSETSETEASKEGKITLSHTIEKRIEPNEYW